MNRKITVAVPTRNRAELLAQTLASITAMHIPDEIELECVIVDNNSTDETNDVVERFARHAPIAVRYVMETRAGSSYARNRAVATSDCDYIFFIDDDAVAEPNWAIELLTAIEHRKLDAACGIVLPKWAGQPPHWLGPRLYSRLAVHDESALSGLPQRELDSVNYYYSANTGFLRETFELFGGFREDLGVVGDNPMSGEDTELFARIIARGGVMGFVPSARVHHMIGPERMTRRYLRRKSFAFGFGSAIAGGRTHNHLDKLARNAVRMVAAAARLDTEGAVYHELECANFFGYWRGRLRTRR
ncbi:MAG: glycosyltransferase [Candidatus Binataceae bacterium]